MRILFTILQFYCIFDKINATLVNINNLFKKKHSKKIPNPFQHYDLYKITWYYHLIPQYFNKM